MGPDLFRAHLRFWNRLSRVRRAVSSEEAHLRSVYARHAVAHSTPCFVLVGGTNHDLGTLVWCRLAVDESLVTRRRPAAQYADRIQLIYAFRNCHQLRHRAKGLAAKVRVGAGDYYSTPRFGERRDELHDTGIEKLSFIDPDYLRCWIEALRDLRRRVDRNCFYSSSIVTGDGINPCVALVQTGFEDLYAFARYQGASYPAYELLALSAEHDTSNYFDPAAGVLVSDAHRDLPLEGAWTARRPAGSSAAVIAIRRSGAWSTAKVPFASFAGGCRSTARRSWGPLFPLGAADWSRAAFWRPTEFLARRTIFTAARVAGATRVTWRAGPAAVAPRVAAYVTSYVTSYVA